MVYILTKLMYRKLYKLYDSYDKILELLCIILLIQYTSCCEKFEIHDAVSVAISIISFLKCPPIL